ncbi:MAG TPA: SGNH/GDSL hydrolase family protein [Asticcacaulis sp.]|nr:SGNH/GDSL hydrolase family protein [Asticcacaulis sp.]
MSNITTTAADVFRDYELTGNPGSGEHDPVKAEIRALFGTVDAAIDAVTLGLLNWRGAFTPAASSGSTGYPTTGGSGVAGAIKARDVFIANQAGYVRTTAISGGDLVIAVTDTPGQTAANWQIISSAMNTALFAAKFGFASNIYKFTSTNIYPGGTSAYASGALPPGVFIPAGATGLNARVSLRLDLKGFGYLLTGRTITVTAEFLTSASFAHDFNFTGIRGQRPDGLAQLTVANSPVLTQASSTRLTAVTSATCDGTESTIEPEWRLGSEVLGSDEYFTPVNVSIQITATPSTTTLTLAEENERLALAIAQASAIDPIVQYQQIIGYGDTPANGNANTAGTYVNLNQPVEADGIIKRLRLRGQSGASSVKVRRFTRSGTSLVQVAGTSDITVVTGADNNDIIVNIPVKKGEYIGFYGPSGCFEVLATGQPRTVLWANDTSDVTTVSTASIVTYSVNVSFYIEYNDYHAQEHSITTKNSELIGFLGDSLCAAGPQQRDKQWMAKASAFTDYRMENFSLGGSTAVSRLTYIRNYLRTFGDQGWRDYNVSHAVLMLGYNEATGGSTTTAQFTEAMRQLVETVRGEGAIPVIATEYTDDYELGQQAGKRLLAEQWNCGHIDLIPTNKKFKAGTQYGGFFQGIHPNVRANELISGPIEQWLRSLGRPAQSVKIFRKRSGVTVSTIQDLMFDGFYDRTKLFKEIRLGHQAFKATSGDQGLYDKADTAVDATNSEILESEYIQLETELGITMDDYSLIEVVLPTIPKKMVNATLVLGSANSGVTVYVRDTLAQPYVTTTAPQGVWHNVATDGLGNFILPRELLTHAMRFDKLSFLIVKSGGFTLTSPRLDWIGEIGKPSHPLERAYGRPARGAELLTTTATESSGTLPAAWTGTGSPTVTATTTSVPRNKTGFVTLDATKKIRQVTSYTQDDYVDREIEIRISRRRYPALFDPTVDTYPTNAGITSDTFDYALVNVDIWFASNAQPWRYQEKAGLWWDDIVVRTWAPCLTTGFTIELSADSAVQIADVSVKFVD